MPQLPVYPAFGTPFIELVSIDSTNNYALQQIHAGLAQHGTAFFAHEQVAGKGQRGKIWTMQKGQNVILSQVINPAPLSLSRQFQLSACMALAAFELFRRKAGDDTRIKWPNDIYWQDRKAGGILIENIVGATGQDWKWAVAGIGMNINQTEFPDSVKNAVSLKQITGKEFSPLSLARELCELTGEYFRLLTREGFEPVYQHYLSHLYKRGEKVRFRKENRTFEATVRTVTPEGRLQILHGLEEEFSVGQVEWIF